jgi:hypothetical protein
MFLIHPRDMIGREIGDTGVHPWRSGWLPDAAISKPGVKDRTPPTIETPTGCAGRRQGKIEMSMEMKLAKEG